MFSPYGIFGRRILFQSKLHLYSINQVICRPFRSEHAPVYYNLPVSFTERDSPLKIPSIKKIIDHQCIVQLLTLKPVRKTLSCKLFYSL